MTPLALDIAIGGIIFLSVLISYIRGIIKEIFTLLGLGVAGFASYSAGHLLIPGLNKWLDVPAAGSDKKAELIFGVLSPAMTAKVVAYSGTFLVVFLFVALTGFMMSRLTKEAGLGIVDRLAGAAFGALRGFLLVFLVYVPCTYLIDQSKFPDWAKNSYSLPVLQKTLDWTNEKFELDKMIKDKDGGISIKIDKVDMDKGTSEPAPEEQAPEGIETEAPPVEQRPDEIPTP